MTDFKYFQNSDTVSRYYKVGKWNKSTGGQYWFECGNYVGASTSTTPAILTTPSPEMNRVTAFTWELGGAWPTTGVSPFMAKVEVTYYVAFKDRRWSLQG